MNLPKVSPRNLPLMMTELQEVFSILVYCKIMVISVDMGECVINNSQFVVDVFAPLCVGEVRR